MKTLFQRLTKSRSDKRDYLLKKLPNGMKCLLIQDKEADKSSAAMNVNVGSLLDPKDFYGLAHFLEHMLFMGTQKYPSENDFMEFLNSNSGHSNAFTDLDSTNYFFDVSNEAFESAVDRFAQFFIKPLFNSSAVEREVRAVDSENKKNLQSDMWRFMQLMRSEGHQNSAFTRFSTGNLETLNKPNIRDALVDYHEKYYSSNLMSLVVLSPQNLNEMDSLTDHLFSQVLKRNLTSEELQTYYSQTYPYLKGDNLGYFYKIQPVKEKDELSFYWVINENTNPLYTKKPLSYLSSLIGHEGENSLHASLIKDDLISSLSAGYTTVANTFTKFYIHIDLTKKGLQNYESVTRRVMKYIEIIQQTPINLNFFQEMKTVQQIKFDYKNKEDPTSYVSDLAYNFTIYNPEDILTGAYIISSYDENFIRKYMDSLALENMNIYLSSKSLEDLNSSEFWYGTKFSKEKFLDKLDNKFSFIRTDTNLIKHKMGYPPVNKFLPTNFDLLDLSKSLIDKYDISPQKIKENNQSTVWYKQDNIFRLPKAAVVLQIYLNKSFLPVKAYDTICSVWNSLIDNELKNLTYMASEANLHFKFFFNLEGIYLQITGFNSSLKNATYEILNKLKQIITNPKGIEEINEKLKTQIEDHKKDYKNFYYSAPYTQAISYLEVLLREPSTSPMMKLEYLNEYNEDLNQAVVYDCHYFIEHFLKESRFEWLVQGNISEEETLQLVESSEKILHNKVIKEENLAHIRIAQIPEMVNYYYVLPAADKNNQNSAIVSFFQAGKLDDYEKCLMFLIESLLREKFFDELRTKQTLGYIVKFAHREMRKIDGFICLVQSSVVPPEDIQDRITKFLITNNLKLELKDEDFEKHRLSVLTELKIKDLKLMEEVSRNFSEIKKRTYDFSRKQKLIELTEKAKKEDVQNLFEKIFIKSQRRLDIEILAENHKEENQVFEKKEKEMKLERVKVNSEHELKRTLKLFPDYYSIYQNIYPKY